MDRLSSTRPTTAPAHKGNPSFVHHHAPPSGPSEAFDPTDVTQWQPPNLTRMEKAIWKAIPYEPLILAAAGTALTIGTGLVPGLIGAAVGFLIGKAGMGGAIATHAIETVALAREGPEPASTQPALARVLQKKGLMEPPPPMPSGRHHRSPQGADYSILSGSPLAGRTLDRITPYLDRWSGK